MRRPLIPRPPARALAPRLVLAALATLLAAERAVAQARLPPAVELRVPKPPTLGAGGGSAFLVYELHVTNWSAAPLAVRRIEVLSDADARVLQTLDDSALVRALTRPGVSPAPAWADRPRLGGGLRGVWFLWVPVDRARPPGRIRHRLTLVPADTAPAQTIEGAEAAVVTDAAVIGPPLRGGPWLAANGPDSVSGHRRGLLAATGLPTIAQRFAIDYVKLGDDGRTYAGDRLKNESYHAQGMEAVAVADGIVVATKDSIPENIPGPTSRAVPITLETVGGNHVILDIGQGRYAFYAHLQPGSLRVRTGDRVRRGQVLGLVGNSGNSTEPHLHFHLSDGTSPLGAEGIPYVHGTFELVGRCKRIMADCDRGSHETRRNEMPMGNMIVRFPER